MAGTPGMWIGIRSIPTYGSSGGPGPTPIIGACATLAQAAKPAATVTQAAKPTATVTQTEC